MAEVYLAAATGVGGFSKPVALKLILPAFADEPEFERMFLAEARLAARLDHPNIAQVIDVGEAHGELYIAMEHIHGRTTRSLLVESDGPPPLEVGLFILLGACAALRYAHDIPDPDGRPLGVVHRDISPSNLMVRYDGQVKLLDFGIAKASSATKATRSGTLKGKGGYMSPEQCLGLPLDRRSDIFGLGILLYELTTGRRLFRGDNDYDVMNRIVQGRYLKPSGVIAAYPSDLEAVIVRALELRPENRFATVADLEAALLRVVQRCGLRPSAPAVAAYLRSMFGEPPPLDLPVLHEPEPVQAVEASAPGTGGSGRSWGSAAAVAIGVLLGGAGVGLLDLAGPSDQVRSPEPAPATSEMLPTNEAAAPAQTPERPAIGVAGQAAVGVGVREARDDGAPQDDAEPEPEPEPEPLGAAEDANAEPDDPPPEPMKSKSRSRSRRSRSKKSAPAPEARQPLFPWKD